MKRTRANSAPSEASDESADEEKSDSDSSDSEHSTRKKSKSLGSVILMGAKEKNTGDDKSKKRDKERPTLKPKSRATRQKSEDSAAEEDIKAEDED